MSDQPFTTPKLKSPAREPQPREQLFEFSVGPDRHLCELCDHGDAGTEAQFYKNGELIMGRRFDSREEAIQWAAVERAAIAKDGPN